jgi:hypothetical protein
VAFPFEEYSEEEIRDYLSRHNIFHVTVFRLTTMSSGAFQNISEYEKSYPGRHGALISFEVHNECSGRFLHKNYYRVNL